MGFIIIVAIVGIVIYLSKKTAKKNREQWQSAADQLKLNFLPGGIGRIGTISGKHGGHSVNVTTMTKGSGNNSQTYTKYTVKYRSRIRVDFKLTKQHALHGLGKVFGMQDIEVGSPVFDGQVLVQGSFPDEIRRFLTPGLQEQIRMLVAMNPDSVITNEGIELKKKGTDRDAAIIVQTVRRLLDFSNELQESVQPENKRTAPPPPRTPPPLPVVEQAPEPPHPSALPVVEEITLPTEPEVFEPEAVVPDADDSAVVFDLKQVAVDLFGAGDSRAVLMARSEFEAKYAGRLAEGSGVLKRVDKFTYDPVFKDTKGVKATIEICEVAGAYSKTKISAVIIFPMEDFDSLKAGMGTVLPVCGKLIAVDTMMSQLFVVEV